MKIEDINYFHSFQVCIFPCFVNKEIFCCCLRENIFFSARCFIGLLTSFKLPCDGYFDLPFKCSLKNN